MPYENVIIREEDYPIPTRWKEIYRRTCAVQDRFFEAMFDTSRGA